MFIETGPDDERRSSGRNVSVVGTPVSFPFRSAGARRKLLVPRVYKLYVPKGTGNLG